MLLMFVLSVLLVIGLALFISIIGAIRKLFEKDISSPSNVPELDALDAKGKKRISMFKNPMPTNDSPATHSNLASQSQTLNEVTAEDGEAEVEMQNEREKRKSNRNEEMRHRRSLSKKKSKKKLIKANYGLAGGGSVTYNATFSPEEKIVEKGGANDTKGNSEKRRKDELQKNSLRKKPTKRQGTQHYEM